MTTLLGKSKIFEHRNQQSNNSTQSVEATIACLRENKGVSAYVVGKVTENNNEARESRLTIINPR